MRSLITLFLLGIGTIVFAQNTFDAPMSLRHMKADLTQFRAMREAANSGVYKYRTPAEIDSIYYWAFAKLDDAETFGDLYNVLCNITDFEGSLHNNTTLPPKVMKALRQEQQGYFPFMIKLVGENWRCNNDNVSVPLGAKIISINDIDIQSLIREVNRYYTTDGFNITGKQIGINVSFPYYFRIRYGKQDHFTIVYEEQNGQQKSVTLESVSYQRYRQQQKKRHSAKADILNYASDDLLEKRGKLYYSKLLDDQTAMLVVNSFSIGGNADAPEHKTYVHFLDSTFTAFRKKGITQLIVDVRYNGGGTDPNDLVTYSYL
ncbi:MAG: peptidase, partial [Bacteroidota bacterium]